MPDIRVQDEQGRVHIFPDGSTPEMIAKAMGVKLPSAAPLPNLQTGQGMEQQAITQSHRLFTGGTPSNPIGSAKPTYTGGPPSLLQEAGDEQTYNQTRLGVVQNRAAYSPTPFTNSVIAYAPVAAAKSIAGAKLGSAAGGAVADEPGEVIGGIAGGVLGGVPWNRSSFGKAIINPSTLEPRAGIKFLPWMNNERATALGDIVDPNLPKVRNMLQATEESMPSRIEELAVQGKQQALLGQENAAAIKRMPNTSSSVWQAPAHETIPLGSPEYPGPFSKIPNRLPSAGRGDPFAPQPQETATSPRVVPFDAGEPRMAGNEGRAATWTNEDVQRLASQGNREAIQQAVRRGMQLPPGARYVMGDPDFSRTVYNPRESTTFTPEGQPIRNVDNPTVSAPRQRIQIPQAGAVPRETINAATGEVYLPPTETAPESSVFAPERRSSLRNITGPNPMRNALMDQLRARVATGDTLAQQQLDDMIAHPFERHEGGDISQMKTQKTLSRAEAEASAKKRLEGRTKRFGSKQ